MAGVASNSLAVDYNRLRVTLGREAGYGTDYSDWDTDQADVIDEAIRRGLAMYYHPPIAPGQTQVYVWSWLRPVWYMQTVSDQRRYDLPDCFERFDGRLFFRGSMQQNYPPIELTSLQMVSELESGGGEAGTPTLAALEPVLGNGTEAQRYVLVLHPTPDSSYDLGAVIVAKQTMLSTSNPVPLGGDSHAELLTLACLAKLDEILDNGQSTYMQQFAMRLAADIGMDIRRGGNYFGYMGDGSHPGNVPRSELRDALYTQPTTYEGSDWQE